MPPGGCQNNKLLFDILGVRRKIALLGISHADDDPVLVPRMSLHQACCRLSSRAMIVKHRRPLPVRRIILRKYNLHPL